ASRARRLGRLDQARRPLVRPSCDSTEAVQTRNGSRIGWTAGTSVTVGFLRDPLTLDRSPKTVLTCGSGPRGIRTPDLMAASHRAVNGVLCKESAGYKR